MSQARAAAQEEARAVAAHELFQLRASLAAAQATAATAASLSAFDAAGAAPGAEGAAGAAAANATMPQVVAEVEARVRAACE